MQSLFCCRTAGPRFSLMHIACFACKARLFHLLHDCKNQIFTHTTPVLHAKPVSLICCMTACKACLFHVLHNCRNISESMKGLWKNSTTRRSQVSASLMDKPKVCSYCGTVGHNRRGCPKLHPEKQHTEKVRVNACIVFRVLGIMQHVLGKLSQNQRIFTPANGSGIHVGLSTACTA